MAKHRTVMRHRRPSKSKQAELLDRQNGRCFYCLCKLSEWMTIHRKPAFTGLHWDHVIPWSFCQKNDDENFVASCQLCNMLKADKVFEAIGEARNYVRQERIKRGLPLFQLPKLPKLPKANNQKKEVAEILLTHMPNGALLEKPLRYRPRRRPRKRVWTQIAIVNGEYVGVPVFPHHRHAYPPSKPLISKARA